MDSYFRGNSQEVEFCKKVHAGGNHLSVATASGIPLAHRADLRMNARQLAPVLRAYKALPLADRVSKLPDPDEATPPRRPVPQLPENGLAIRGYCTYLQRNKHDVRLPEGALMRARQRYYGKWAAETQSDMLWLTEPEWKSLIPTDPRVGGSHDVADRITERLFRTVGIDYMEGSVNALPVREASLTLTVEEFTKEHVNMRLEGKGQMGRPFAENAGEIASSRGCELRVLGYISYDRQQDAIVQFHWVGVGQSWGRKMSYLNRSAIQFREEPWLYGVAGELVTTDFPMDRLPPYNMIHYGGKQAYFADD